MSYGDNIQRGRDELAAALAAHRGTIHAEDLAARDLLVTGLAEISALLVGPADSGTAEGWRFERGIIRRPAVYLNRLLTTAAATLPAPDPTKILNSSSSLSVAAKHVTLAAADLSSDASWHANANQQWVVAKDVADLTRAATVIEMNRTDRDRQPLPNAERLLLAANTAGQVARSGRLDFVVDTVGHTPPQYSVLGAQSQSLLAGLRGQQEVAANLTEVPTFRNLRHIVRHQAQVSARIQNWLDAPIDPAMATRHAERQIAYLHIFKELRGLNGNLGRGLEAAAASSHTASVIRFGAAPVTTPADRNVIAALTTACDNVDRGVANVIQAGLRDGIYHIRHEVSRPDEQPYAPTWASVDGILRDIGPDRPLEWARPAEPNRLNIWRLADALRSDAPIHAPQRIARRRSDTDTLDRLLSRSGQGPRPERPHSR